MVYGDVLRPVEVPHDKDGLITSARQVSAYHFIS